MRKFPSILAALTICLLSASVLVAEDKPADKKVDTKAIEKGPAINKFCAVEGGDHTVDPDVYTIYKGQKIGFCCKDCVKDFESDPDTYMQKLHARHDDGTAKKEDKK
jgi:hypothetical protein